MKFHSAALLAIAAASNAFAKRTCGALPPTDEQLLVAQNMQLEEDATQRRTGNFSIQATTNVNIYFHVVASSTSVANGYISQASLTSQLAVLNQAFASSGFSFTQAGADWTVNSAWASDSSEMAMKQALRKGTYADLNLYFVRSSRYLGYAYLPQTFSTGSTAFVRDGVVAVGSTTPGGSYVPYNLGHTATHEIGHWLGLYHTFEGYACSGNGDYVSDTPFESEESYGCEIGRDTCPSSAGLDSVTNFMNYSDDDCMTYFSAGQAARMTSQWNTYRAPYQS